MVWYKTNKPQRDQRVTKEVTIKGLKLGILGIKNQEVKAKLKNLKEKDV